MPQWSCRLVLAGLVAWTCVAVPASRVAALEGSLESVSTLVDVKLDDRLSSQESKVGDTFAFELTGSVILDGEAVGAGTRGHGVVVTARPGSRTRRASLTLAARSLDLASGTQIPVGLGQGSLDAHAAPRTRDAQADDRIVYEIGTRFTIVSPPPETPAPGDSPGP